MEQRHRSFVDRLALPLRETFGLTQGMALSIVGMVFLVLFAAVFWFMHSAPPKQIIITTGPAGSMFETNAYRYMMSKTFTNKHVHEKLVILQSKGSQENLDRLSDPNFKVDVGFVQGGITNAVNDDGKLVSLGSIAYVPLLVFYRSSTPVNLLSDFKGERLAIGPAGSGTKSLSTDLLALNGVAGSNTTLLELDSVEAAKALIEGNVDAAFMMGDSASGQVMRELFRAPGVQLFDFTQADGYVRKISYLNKLVLPKGSFDFGKNVPSHDITLLAPTVELIARSGLHPALSDLLLDSAREVHKRASLLQRKGEFPSGAEHDFPISKDAARYYTSGKSFLYKYLPFGLAGLLTRIVVAFVPAMVILIPALKVVPAMFRLRMKLLLYRRYRAMLALEREVQQSPMSKERHDELQKQVTEIEGTVNEMKVPASYADQYYALRTYVVFLRQQLASRNPQKAEKPTA